MPCLVTSSSDLNTHTHSLSLLSLFSLSLCLMFSEEFKKILTKQGLKFKTSTKVTGVSKEGNVHKVAVEAASGGSNETVCAHIGTTDCLHATDVLFVLFDRLLARC
jgi:hypothetical protein